MHHQFCSLCFAALAVLQVSSRAEAFTPLEWRELASLPSSSDSGAAHLGLAGPYVCISNDALIVAGGANFPKPVWETEKVWHDNIDVLVKDGASESGYRWLPGGQLPRPIAYGASVATSQGIVCIGGNDAEQVYDDVILLRWDQEKSR